MDENILAALSRIENQIAEQAINTKEVLTFDEACRYLQVSKSFMYKQTSSNSIVHYSPGGKLIYFRRDELNAWLLRNRRSTEEEIQAQAMDRVIMNHKKRRTINEE